MSFIRSANLRALLSKDACPEAIEHCHKIFQKLTDPGKRSTVLLDLSSGFRNVVTDDDDKEAEDEDQDALFESTSTKKISLSTLEALKLHMSHRNASMQVS